LHAGINLTNQPQPESRFPASFSEMNLLPYSFLYHPDYSETGHLIPCAVDGRERPLGLTGNFDPGVGKEFDSAVVRDCLRKEAADWLC
jgi:hypothetical protein